MQILEQLIRQQLQALGVEGSSDELTRKIEQKKVEEYNAQPAQDSLTVGGRHHLFDTVYDCPVCKHKGLVAFLNEDGAFAVHDCNCRRIRSSRISAVKSGLGELLNKRVNTFHAEVSWQAQLRERTIAFIECFRRQDMQLPKGFVMLGQSGCGKTHLCAAVCNFFIDQGKQVRYMSWLNTADELKILRIEEPASYRRRMEELSCADVLHIDDLFKAKLIQGISERDVTLAFEILNHRLNLPEGITIVSSEWLAEDLRKVDTAVAGRLLELSGDYLLQIPRGDRYNWRIQG